MRENYPSGSEHDSRAPWNHKTPKEQKRTFNSELEDKDANKYEVKITYWFRESSHSPQKFITSYKFQFNSTPDIPEDYIDEMIRNLIGDDIGDRYYEFAD